MNKFPKGTKIIIQVVFKGEYRIGWEYDGKKYIPGSSYYAFEEAVENAWDAFLEIFPYE